MLQHVHSLPYMAIPPSQYVTWSTNEDFTFAIVHLFRHNQTTEFNTAQAALDSLSYRVIGVAPDNSSALHTYHTWRGTSNQHSPRYSAMEPVRRSRSCITVHICAQSHQQIQMRTALCMTCTEAGWCNAHFRPIGQGRHPKTTLVQHSCRCPSS